MHGRRARIQGAPTGCLENRTSARGASRVLLHLWRRIGDSADRDRRPESPKTGATDRMPREQDPRTGGEPRPPVSETTHPRTAGPGTRPPTREHHKQGPLTGGLENRTHARGRAASSCIRGAAPTNGGPARRRRRSRVPEPHLLARAKLRDHVERRRRDDRDHGVAAGDRPVGEQDRGLARPRDLDRPRHRRLARQFPGDGAIEHRAVEAGAHAIGRGRAAPGAVEEVRAGGIREPVGARTRAGDRA